MKELQGIVQHTIPILFDQCQYGLRHPNDSSYLKKTTRIQSTSEELQSQLDGRFCRGQHSHTQIAGSCVFQGKAIRLSRFSAFYPAVLARKISRAILKECRPPALQALCVHEVAFPITEETKNESGEHPEAPSPKRRRAETRDRRADEDKEHFGAEKGPLYDASNRAWEAIFNRLQSILPKSGTRTWSGSEDRLIRECQALCPDIDIKHAKAGKGLDKYMQGPKDSPYRQTIVQSRFDRSKVYDLGSEAWQRLSQAQQKRKALPSHIMIGLFGNNPEDRPLNPEDRPLREVEPPSSRVADDVPMEGSAPGEVVQNPQKESSLEKTSPSVIQAPGWSPAPVINSGPRFLALDQEQQNAIKKMHHNLGHPTADRLAKHLSSLGVSAMWLLCRKKTTGKDYSWEAEAPYGFQRCRVHRRDRMERKGRKYL